MSTIFSKIISGEIPCHSIYEDNDHLAFLDIQPLAPGHTLVIPKKESSDVFDLNGPEYDALWQVSQRVARLLKKKTGCHRVAVLILGYEVNHTHIHLIPTNSESDILPPVRSNPTQAELSAVAEKLREPVASGPSPNTQDIANRWDELAGCFTKNIEPSTVELAKSTFSHLKLETANSILEIGCGGGAAAEALALHIQEGASLIASDISSEMIGIARERLDDEIITFIADAQNLPFEDSEFDRILANLNLMLVPDPDLSVQEAFRVLQPGGFVVYTVWGRPEHSPLMTAIPQAAAQVGLSLPKPVRSNFHLGGTTTLKRLLEKHGFEGVLQWYQPMIIPISSGSEYVNMNTQMMDMMDIPEEQRPSFQAALITNIDNTLSTGQPIQLDVRIVVAQKPNSV